MASNGRTINEGTSNYTNATNTCCAGKEGKANFKNGTIKYGKTTYSNGEKYTGGNDRNVAHRVQTAVNKPWKKTDRGF